MMENNKRSDVLKEIKCLAQSAGYIYALCMMLYEDFHVELINIQEVDWHQRLSMNEVALLLGFLIQKKIDFTKPRDPEIISSYREKTYLLLRKLHDSYNAPHLSELQELLGSSGKKTINEINQKKHFMKAKFMVEPIFYSGCAAYDIQYLDFLGKKYKYDKDWLKNTRKFDIEKSKEIAILIKEICIEKGKRIHLTPLQEFIPKLMNEMPQEHPNENMEKSIKDFIPILQFHQYRELFLIDESLAKNGSDEEIRAAGWDSFYDGILDLFAISKSDFDLGLNVTSFLDNFSIEANSNCNQNFNEPGDYNQINSHPIIRLSNDRYFVPNIFLMFEALYESPFYWMLEDSGYKDELTRNRGLAGEEIVYDFLNPIFGKKYTYKSVKVRESEFGVTTQKSKDLTDVDVLCVLGSKALCVQVKSKKLTQLARKGSDEYLQKDFKAAVQDAYNQGLVTRKAVLGNSAKFFDSDNNEIILSEKINDVYLMCVTTENFPALAHQVTNLLSKKQDDPYPVVFTIFDLELIAHYLKDPYDFLYYLRQRSSLADYFVANQEMTYLGYHLTRKLSKNPKANIEILDDSLAVLIDRNYYPLKLGLDFPDTGDQIKMAWQNKDFDLLCQRIKTLTKPKITDVIFYLLDLSGDARDALVSLMINTKVKTQRDGKSHNFSMPPDERFEPRLGFTYAVCESNNLKSLQSKVLRLSQIRKYKDKGDAWIGFGSLKSSAGIIDCIAFSDDKWRLDPEFEKGLPGNGCILRMGKKIGRNEKCPCGSELKYKKCCM